MSGCSWEEGSVTRDPSPQGMIRTTVQSEAKESDVMLNSLLTWELDLFLLPPRRQEVCPSIRLMWVSVHFFILFFN